MLAAMAASLPSKPRTTPRLELRPFRRRDLEPLHDAVIPSLDVLNKWLPWAHRGYGRRDALIFIRDSVNAWHEGRAFDFAIRYRDDSRTHLGNISVWFTSRQSLVGEMGYWIRTDHSRSGVATEAGARVLQVAFEELGMHRVSMRIAVGNTGSEKVAQKLGFTREGLLREELLVAGQWLDHSVWGLLEPEYRLLRDRYTAAGLLLAGSA